MLAYQLKYLFFRGMGQYMAEMRKQPLKRLLRRTFATTGIRSEEGFRGGQERPAPSVFTPVLVGGIHEVFGYDITSHLQAGDVTVELASHLRPVEATCLAQLTRYQTVVLLQSKQYGFLDGTFLRSGMLTATIIIEVGPPLAAYETGLIVIELTINASALLNDGTFPLPQRPVPTAIRECHITAVVAHDGIGREPADTTIEKRQETHLLNVRYQFGRRINLFSFHLFVFNPNILIPPESPGTGYGGT